MEKGTFSKIATAGVGIMIWWNLLIYHVHIDKFQTWTYIKTFDSSKRCWVLIFLGFYQQYLDYDNSITQNPAMCDSTVVPAF